MNGYNSPYSATPNPEYYYSGASPSPTPSPRHNYFYPQTPQRPATRAHFRHSSSGGNQAEYRNSTFSPRYTSNGEYATGTSGPKVSSSRKQSFSKGAHHMSHPQAHLHPAQAFVPTTWTQTSRRERRHSQSLYRASHGDSEDEYFEVDGVTYVISAAATPGDRDRPGDRRRSFHYSAPAAGHGTDYYYPTQGAAYCEDPIQRSATRIGNHARRPSNSVPQRPATVRPSSAQGKKAPSVAKATDADARKHRIPQGYSLKNWDPTEEPILLLGSVFDSNSLGKWIYDWTVYHHGAGTPISDMAGDMWLLLIQLSGKVKRAEECVPRIRAKEKREMVEDFIESGERLTDKLRLLLKRCEAPMLKVSKRKDAPQLGKGSGVEFVETLFGRERELDKAERFMQSVRLWNLRFDANCEEILKKPTL